VTPEQKAAALAAAKAAKKTKSEAEPASAAGGTAVATLEMEPEAREAALPVEAKAKAQAEPEQREPMDDAKAAKREAALAAAKATVRAKAGAPEAALPVVPEQSEPTDAKAKAQAKAAALAAAKAAAKGNTGAANAATAPAADAPTDAKAQARAAALAAAKAKAAGKAPAAKQPALTVAPALGAKAAPKRMSAKMALSIIIFVMVILLSSGAFVVKLLVWNDYNSATQMEKLYRANIEKLKTHPEDLEVRYELLSAMYRKGQHDAARLQLQYIEEHAAPDSELLIKSMYYKGLYLSMDNQYEEALEAYDRFLQSYPASGEALVNVGYVYYSLGRYEEAGMMIGKAGVFLPRSPEVPCLFGMLALKNDRKAEAELMFTKALELDSRHAKSLEMLKTLREKGEQASGATN